VDQAAGVPPASLLEQPEGYMGNALVELRSDGARAGGLTLRFDAMDAFAALLQYA